MKGAVRQHHKLASTGRLGQHQNVPTSNPRAKAGSSGSNPSKSGSSGRSSSKKSGY